MQWLTDVWWFSSANVMQLIGERWRVQFSLTTRRRRHQGIDILWRALKIGAGSRETGSREIGPSFEIINGISGETLGAQKLIHLAIKSRRLHRSDIWSIRASDRRVPCYRREQRIVAVKAIAGPQWSIGDWSMKLNVSSGSIESSLRG